ncbi:hypothetical protein NFI96_000176, partial [Prochilodus magdalenae]
WPVTLRQQEYTSTSVKNMLLNVSAFIKHLKTFHSEIAGLSMDQMGRMLLQIKRLQRNNSQNIQGHQQHIRRHKSKLMRATGDFRCFMHIARYQVPKLIRSIQRKPSITSYLLQGYVSGHHPVVLWNLTKADLQEAETDDQKWTMLWVTKHKTDHCYENAFLALRKKLTGFMHLQRCPEHLDCPYMLQWKGHQVRQVRGLNTRLRQAWRHAGMSGDITFGIIRVSVTTQAKNHLFQEERSIVCDSMCHDVATADRFYTAMPELQEVFGIRKMRMKALELQGQTTMSDGSLKSDLSEGGPGNSETNSDSDESQQPLATSEL